MQVSQEHTLLVTEASRELEQSSQMRDPSSRAFQS